MRRPTTTIITTTTTALLLRLHSFLILLSLLRLPLVLSENTTSPVTCNYNNPYTLCRGGNPFLPSTNDCNTAIHRICLALTDGYADGLYEFISSTTPGGPGCDAQAGKLAGVDITYNGCVQEFKGLVEGCGGGVQEEKGKNVGYNASCVGGSKNIGLEGEEMGKWQNASEPYFLLSTPAALEGGPVPKEGVITHRTPLNRQVLCLAPLTPTVSTTSSFSTPTSFIVLAQAVAPPSTSSSASPDYSSQDQTYSPPPPEKVEQQLFVRCDGAQEATPADGLGFNEGWHPEGNYSGDGLYKAR